MRNVLLLVPTHNGQAGGEVYDLAIQKSIDRIADVKVREVYPEVEALKRWLAPVFRRCAFMPLIYETAMILKYASILSLFDGLLVQNYHACRYTWLGTKLRRILGRKTITIVHHFEESHIKDNSRLLQSRLRYIGSSDHLITISQFSKTEVIRCGYPARRITVIPPGTDHITRYSTQVFGATTNKRYILSIGTVAPHKGFDILVAAMAQCKSKDFDLVIAGSVDMHPDYVALLKSTILSSGLSERVKLVGRVSDNYLSELLSGAFLYVMPSLIEGYCMAVAEGLIYGLPMIITTAGALPELVTDGVEGLHAEPGSSLDLSQKIDIMCTDNLFRDTCKAAAKQRGMKLPNWQDFSISVEKICSQYL